MKVNPPGAVAALVCGILSIVFCWVPIAGLVLGIIAILQAGKAKRIASSDGERYEQGGVRVGGFVCGIVGTCFAGIYTIYFVLFVVLLAGAAQGM